MNNIFYLTKFIPEVTPLIQEQGYNVDEVYITEHNLSAGKELSAKIVIEITRSNNHGCIHSEEECI